MKKIKLKKKWKYMVIICIIMGLVFGGYSFYKNSTYAGQVNQNKNSSSALVERGDLSVTISGTGTVSPIERYEIVPLVKGSIVYAPFEEGMEVKEGDVLYKFDDSEVLIDIQKTKNSIARSNLSNESNEEDIKNLVVTTPYSGRIMNFSVNVGDKVSEGKIADIVDDEKLIAKVPFNSTQFENIEVGQDARVISSEYMQYIEGKVVSKDDSGKTYDDGTILYEVEIEIPNLGAIEVGTEVLAEVSTSKGNMISPLEGELEYSKEQTLNVETSGTVKSVLVEDNQKVKAGQKIIELENEDLLDKQEESYLDMEDLQLTLQSKQKELEDYSILSPIDGIIIQKNYKEGDTINSSENEVLMVVADMSSMVFDLEIDELDIAKVEKGQKVKVTADALPDEEFEGEITYINTEGESENGVTTYKVEVTIEDYGELRSGMNVNAEIVVQQKDDVLYLPISAVQKKNGKTFVFVKSDGSDGSDGRMVREIEVGINNEEYIEVISGLEEGEEVVLPYQTSDTTTENTEMKGGFGIPGMGGGGGQPPREPRR